MFKKKSMFRKSNWVLHIGIIAAISGLIICVADFWKDEVRHSSFPDIALVFVLLILLTVTADSLLNSREATKTEKALKESEKRYRELADSLPEVIFEMDMHGNLMWVNKTAFEVFGYGFSDFKPGRMNALDTLIKEDRDRALQNIARIGKGDEIGLSEYTCVRHDGSTFPALFSTKLVKDIKGNPAGFRGVILNITDRKNAEKLMREEADRTNRWFEELKEGAYVNSVEGAVLNVNASAAKLLGYDNVNDLIGMDAREFYVDPEQRETIIAEIRTKGFIRNRNVNLKKKDGTTVQLATTVYMKSGKLFGRFLTMEDMGTEHLIPICSVMECRKIRDECGQWHRFEDYFSDKFDYRFSHSICPSCARALYPDNEMD